MTDDDPDYKGQEDSAESRPTVRVPKYKRGDEVVEWMDVDKEWWEHAQKAREVNKQVVEMVGGEPGVNYIETSRGNETIAGRSTSCITILVTDEETADRLSVPDEIDGIPICVQVGEIRDMPIDHSR